MAEQNSASPSMDQLFEKDEALFQKITEKVNSNFQDMIKEGYHFFFVSLNPYKTGKKIINVAKGNIEEDEIISRPLYVEYLEELGGITPTSKSLIFRVNNISACQKCSHFINKWGVLVGLNKKLEIRTLWEGLDDLIKGTKYQKPIEKMIWVLKNHSTIQTPFYPNLDWMDKGEKGDKRGITTLKNGDFIASQKSNMLSSSFKIPFDPSTGQRATTQYFNHYVGGAEAKAKVACYDKDGYIITKSDDEPEKAKVVRSNTTPYEFFHYYITIPRDFVRRRGTAGDYVADYKSFSNYAYHLKQMLDGKLITKEACLKALQMWETTYPDGSPKPDREVIWMKENNWIPKLFIKLYDEWEKIPKSKRKLWYFRKASELAFEENAGAFLAIGKNSGPVTAQSLLIPLSSGVDEERARRLYLSATNPEKYKVREEKEASELALFNAEKAIVEGGYKEALQRKYASVKDLVIADVDFYDGTKTSVSKDDQDNALDFTGKLFKSVKKDTTSTGFISEKKFENCDIIEYEVFYKNILPKCVGCNVLLQSKHELNLAVMSTTIDPKAKSIFSWGNNFAVITAEGLGRKSTILKQIGSSGSYVNAHKSFSTTWRRNVDIDEHELEILDSGSVFDIYYGKDCRIDDIDSSYSTRIAEYSNSNKFEEMERYVMGLYNRVEHSPGGGVLDQDVRRHPEGTLAVENIFYPKKDEIADGWYIMYDHAFAGTDDLKCQITIGGETREYEWSGQWNTDQFVLVAIVRMDNGSVTKWIDGEDLKKINDSSLCDEPSFSGTKYVDRLRTMVSSGRIASRVSATIVEDSREMFGLKAGDFYPVEMTCITPPGLKAGVKGVTKQYFWAIQNMHCDKELPAFVNEHLSDSFRKKIGPLVLQILKSKPMMTLKPKTDEPQLAGLLFDPSRKDYLITKVEFENGATKVYKVHFGGI